MDIQKPEINNSDIFDDDERLIVSVILNETVARDIGETAISTDFTQLIGDTNSDKSINSADSNPKAIELKLSSELERVNKELLILRKQNEFLQQATKSGLWHMDVTTGRRTYDIQYALMAGYTPDEIKRFNVNSWEYLTHPDDETKFKELIAQCQEGQFDEFSYEKRMRRKDGSWLAVKEFCLVSDKDSDEQVINIVGVTTDISEIKNLEVRNEALTEEDTLTGLYNYYFYNKQLDRLRSSRRKEPVSIIKIEIDKLTKINNIHGWKAGDEQLINIAGILNNVFRIKDCVARIGGNEFAIIMDNTDELAISKTVQRIKQCQDKFNSDYSDMQISLSIGASTAHKDDSIDDAIARADFQLYEDRISKEKSR